MDSDGIGQQRQQLSLATLPKTWVTSIYKNSILYIDREKIMAIVYDPALERLCLDYSDAFMPGGFQCGTLSLLSEWRKADTAVLLLFIRPTVSRGAINSAENGVSGSIDAPGVPVPAMGASDAEWANLSISGPAGTAPAGNRIVPDSEAARLRMPSEDLTY